MVFDFVTTDGEEGAETDVKGEIFNNDAFLLETIEEVLGHIETCSRRSGGAHLLGPDGLVALFVIIGGVAMKIWWQRNSAVLLSQLGERGLGFDFRDAVAQNASNRNTRQRHFRDRPRRRERDERGAP